MTIIAVESSTGEKLRALDHPAQLRDEQGNVLGEFRPAARSPEYAGVDSPMSKDELSRRDQETETYSTADVLAVLRGLE